MPLSTYHERQMHDSLTSPESYLAKHIELDKLLKKLRCLHLDGQSRFSINLFIERVLTFLLALFSIGAAWSLWTTIPESGIGGWGFIGRVGATTALVLIVKFFRRN